jgi:hypothetical protein
MSVILWVVSHGVREAPAEGGSYQCGSAGGDYEPRSPILEGDAVDATRNAVPPTPEGDDVPIVVKAHRAVCEKRRMKVCTPEHKMWHRGYVIWHIRARSAASMSARYSSVYRQACLPDQNRI